VGPREQVSKADKGKGKRSLIEYADAQWMKAS